MQSAPSDMRAKMQAAVSALNSGDAARAAALFDGMIADGGADSQVWLGLAYARQALGDQAGKLAAADKAIEADPRNLRALMMKADHLFGAGEARQAAPLYMAVVKLSKRTGQVPPELMGEAQRAQAMCDQIAGGYERHLRAHLAGKGFDAERSSARFAESLDILVRKKSIYFQQPHFYFLPGLPQIQFYDRANFPWMRAIEAATDDIRTELLQVMAEDRAFTPYVEPMAHKIDRHAMANNPDWSAFFLWKAGAIVAENAARCPKTMAALSAAPFPLVPGRSPSVLFSLLRPGARIPPHNGMINTRLICHLPLIVPEKCRFRVGNEVREWVEGEILVFDDSIEHEAWNDSDETRVVLLFDVWRPEVTAEERALVTAMCAAIDAYGGSKQAWD